MAFLSWCHWEATLWFALINVLCQTINSTRNSDRQQQKTNMYTLWNDDDFKITYLVFKWKIAAKKSIISDCVRVRSFSQFG